MSILEIVLYSIISIAVVLYIGISIYQMIDKKKHPEKYENKKKDKQKKEQQNQDE